jgi:hypothetical protein
VEQQIKPGPVLRDLLQSLRQACEATGRTEEAAAISAKIAAIDSAAAPASQPAAETPTADISGPGSEGRGE